ncbi:hypothetical protein [Thermococcus sp.]
MNVKAILLASFSLIALYFLGIGVLSWGYTFQVAGAALAALLHLGIVWGILRRDEWSIGLGKYLSFLDLIFSILWMMLGVIPQGAALFTLSTLNLVLLSDEDVEARILGRE